MIRAPLPPGAADSASEKMRVDGEVTLHTGFLEEGERLGAESELDINLARRRSRSA